jgi:uncharacterized RDD family membrane protein YckC
MTPAAPLQAPALLRRLACLVYEGLLVFGVAAVAGALYALAIQQRHALLGQTGLRIVLFVVLGWYFVHFWTRSGQTVAMKTWHVRLVDATGGAVSPGRACVRYMLSWLWFAPALFIARVAGWTSGAQVVGLLCAGAAAYAGSTLLRRDRQYWHDIASGTRLVDTRVQGARDAG